LTKARFDHTPPCWSMVKTATGQNGDTETATAMAIFKTATKQTTPEVIVKPISYAL